MKKIILIQLITVLTFSGIYCVPAKTIGGKDKEIVIKTAIYCDHCSQCSDCKPKIETAVNVMQGVTYAKLNVETQSLTVLYNTEKTNETVIKSAVVNAGFTADDMPPNPEAYAKLDECCKKKQ